MEGHIRSEAMLPGIRLPFGFRQGERREGSGVDQRTRSTRQSDVRLYVSVIS